MTLIIAIVIPLVFSISIIINIDMDVKLISGI
ncbi:hypothetical protein ABG79_01831 [Caloramator mitchellensis]|uniref:Uncharacterized protein n=1 Tax=Caloramator mitchellensis TaxID=908809 RepID=A0A0R3K1Z4_CALMK|nr:hypothetical protein ABG79_01831 [Caloramator mitchellensis]